MTDWISVGIGITSAVLLFAQYLVPPRIRLAKDREQKRTKLTLRIQIPKRYPVRTASGVPTLRRERAFATNLSASAGTFLARASGFALLGMLLTLFVLGSSAGSFKAVCEQGPCYGGFAIQINLNPLLPTFLLLLGIQALGFVIGAAAQREKNSPAWEEVIGESLAWYGLPETPRATASLTDDERDYLKRIQEEEDRY